MNARRPPQITVLWICLAALIAGCSPLIRLKSDRLQSAASEEISLVQQNPSTTSTPDWKPANYSRIPGRTTLDGREDPFALLPAEKRAQDQSSGSETVEPAMPEVPVPPVPAGVLRGILLGDPPAAIVEENGQYRKAIVGDSFAGGRIVAILEDGLIVMRDGARVTIRLGD